MEGRGPRLTAWRVSGEGLHARWVSQGLPVTIWTTDDVASGTWELLEELSPSLPAGESVELLLSMNRSHAGGRCSVVAAVHEPSHPGADGAAPSSTVHGPNA